MLRRIYQRQPMHPSTRTAVTMGNFDGIHLGHQALIQQCCHSAQNLGLASTLILFEPQPEEYFKPNDPPARLMRLREKVEMLKNFPLDRIYCLRFNHQLATMEAETFIENILCHALKTKAFIIGEDFHFGYQRAGNVNLLQRAGRKLDFSVELAKTVTDEAGKISSTRIRKSLAAGNLPLAIALLGHPYSLKGHVMYGLGLGRKLSCPTLNIALNRKRSPLFGIYAVSVILQKKIYPGVASIGSRPTVGAYEPLLEVHLLDVNENFYGQMAEVVFLGKIRDEEKFTSLTELQAAMQRDIEIGRAFFHNSL